MYARVVGVALDEAEQRFAADVATLVSSPAMVAAMTPENVPQCDGECRRRDGEIDREIVVERAEHPAPPQLREQQR